MLHLLSEAYVKEAMERNAKFTIEAMAAELAEHGAFKHPGGRHGPDLLVGPDGVVIRTSFDLGVRNGT